MAPDSNEPSIVEDQYKVNIGPQRVELPHYIRATEKPQIPLLDLFALVFELAAFEAGCHRVGATLLMLPKFTLAATGPGKIRVLIVKISFPVESDVPGLKYTIVYGCAGNIPDFVQMGGRDGARDGNATKAFVLAHKTLLGGLEQDDDSCGDEHPLTGTVIDRSELAVENRRKLNEKSPATYRLLNPPKARSNDLPGESPSMGSSPINAGLQGLPDTTGPSRRAVSSAAAKTFLVRPKPPKDPAITQLKLAPEHLSSLYQSLEKLEDRLLWADKLPYSSFPLKDRFDV
ncbi:hypothetical protein L198_00977 [Cryptococcus wingfieldii CBS 7118]|uniref:Uncharacterized protein n=1 Tax=Cryptococcus wingfieldii CBS 7118 TaxID=1295528 RepID=A0A1E3K2J0_9TREE|nr:hypothetical protein L198_00977 [Cryptococcus wingfieldii CBS 7118]ODO07398.1 hypothetical protein L198_00977 [Cryptococcus wingfieldii CBS 7118]